MCEIARKVCIQGTPSPQFAHLFRFGHATGRRRNLCRGHCGLRQHVSFFLASLHNTCTPNDASADVSHQRGWRLRSGPWTCQYGARQTWPSSCSTTASDTPGTASPAMPPHGAHFMSNPLHLANNNNNNENDNDNNSDNT